MGKNIPDLHADDHLPWGADPIRTLGAIHGWQEARYTQSPSVPNNTLSTYNNAANWTLTDGIDLIGDGGTTAFYVNADGLYSAELNATPAASVLAAGTLIRAGISTTNTVYDSGGSPSTVTGDEVDDSYYAPGGVIGASLGRGFGPRYFRAAVGDIIEPFVYQNSGGALTMSLVLRVTFIPTGLHG